MADGEVTAAAFPISIDTATLTAIAQRDEVQRSARRSGTRSATPSWCCSGWTGWITPRESCTGSPPTASYWTKSGWGPSGR